MILYLDTSALLKLFVVEPGSERVEKAVAEAAAVATHLIAYAELRAALARAHSLARVDAQTLGGVIDAIERCWVSLDIIGVTEPLVRRAGDLATRHGLRGYDSVHLAAALTLRDSLGTGADVVLGASDKRLNHAALLHDLLLMTWG